MYHSLPRYSSPTAGRLLGNFEITSYSSGWTSSSHCLHSSMFVRSQCSLSSSENEENLIRFTNDSQTTNNRNEKRKLRKKKREIVQAILCQFLPTLDLGSSTFSLRLSSSYHAAERARVSSSSQRKERIKWTYSNRRIEHLWQSCSFQVRIRRTSLKSVRSRCR